MIDSTTSDSGTPPSATASVGGMGAAALMESIAGLRDLTTRQQDHDRLLAAEGAGHIVHDLPLRADGRMVALESRPWRLDPIPLVIDGDEFVALADGAIARMRMLEAILADLYGARTLLSDSDRRATSRLGVVLATASPHRSARIAALARRRTRSTSPRTPTGSGTSCGPHRPPPGVGYALHGPNGPARVHRDVMAPLPAGRGSARSIRSPINCATVSPTSRRPRTRASS